MVGEFQNNTLWHILMNPYRISVHSVPDESYSRNASCPPNLLACAIKHPRVITKGVSELLLFNA